MPLWGPQTPHHQNFNFAGICVIFRCFSTDFSVKGTSENFGGSRGQTPHPPKISHLDPSLSPGESPVKISRRKNENEVSWEGPKVHIPEIPFIPGWPPLGVFENRRVRALHPLWDYPSPTSNLFQSQLLGLWRGAKSLWDLLWHSDDKETNTHI